MFVRLGEVVFFAQKVFGLVHDNEPRIMQNVTQKKTFVKRK